ncbi:MAG TPA: adenylate/guanylate cyclase domain-containing protein [Actinomycetota bacterium]|nr:adenylate/guanylate cyclase domain-containing protein [Actinomycetota bacterium]
MSKPASDQPRSDFAGNPGVIATTLLSGVIAVAVAAAEWAGSGTALDSPAGILWALVALLGVAAMVLGTGLELRRRRQAGHAPAAAGPAAPAPELPTGTVTFLFTDIEGSTWLLQELGDAYPAVRDEHAAILRRAIRDQDGVEVSTEGDSFFAAFASPVAAVAAAVAAQRGLAAHHWPPGLPVRVRMGLHTGEGVLGGDNYVGIDVNRAARIAGAAHGGQVIVSGATRSLVEHALPEGTALRDLGEHRLKDLNLPIHLNDLVVEGLAADFLPPRTLDARPGNLPAPLTSFIGREPEIAEIRRLLGRARLVTLTGAGGTGKSRLALQAAAGLMDEYRDGVFLAELSSVTDPALVPSALARALRVPEVPGRPILAALQDHLRDRRLLLVADNFEQVTDAGPVVEKLLAAAPGLTVMVTSRAPLSLRGEQELVVPPLTLPEPGRPPDLETLGRSEAVRLFTERAQAVWPGFELTEQNAPAVAEITTRLDGLALAIELAATRTKVLTPEQLLPRLERRLTLLTGGAQTLPDRQRTLRGAIGWSYDLLPAAEQRLFARLSVFAGGWTLTSAEAVCDPEALGLDPLQATTSLVDQSLVTRTEAATGEPRFSMLETIREFGWEQLAVGGELEPVTRRHAEHFLALAVAAEPHLTGAAQGEWLDRCDQEHPNLRVALRWAVKAGEAGRAQEAAGAIWRFWQQRGHLTEGRRWLEELLALPSGQGPTPARAKALAGAGGIAWWQEDIAGARGFYEEALAIERALGDPAGIAQALYNQGFVVAADGDFDGAFGLFEESRELARRAGDEPAAARAEWMLAIRDLAAGAWERPVAIAEQAVATWRRLGDRLQMGDGLVWLAVVYARAGRQGDARSAIGEALRLFREVDSPMGIVSVILGLSYLARWEGRYQDAVRLAGAAESLRDQVGGRPPLGFLVGFVGDPEAEARARLPGDAAEAAWEEGRRLSVDAALAPAAVPPAS